VTVARIVAALSLLPLLAACGDEVLLHRLDEPQANQVLVALGDAGLAARKERDGAEEGAFQVAVRPLDAPAARSLLSARDLPRGRSPGFGELFGSPGLVPTPLEEHARYLHALSGELGRTLESLDGVLGARVHLALPVPDPLRPDARRSPRASVMLKVRPEARGRIESQADGLRRLVAGAADGLDPASVAVLVAEAAASPPARPSGVPVSRAWLAGSGLALAVVLGAGALSLGRRKPDSQ
jgi:type III secretion protein J